MADKNLNIKVTTTSDNKGVQQTNANLQGVEKTSQGLSKSLIGLTGQSKTLTQGLSAVGVSGSTAFLAVGAAVATVTVAIVASIAAVKGFIAAVNALKPGAEFNVLKSKFDELSGGSDNSRKSLELFGKALAGNLDQTKIMQLANSLRLLGNTDQDIAKLFDVAETRTEFFGGDVDAAVEALTRFIETGAKKGALGLKIDIVELEKEMAKLGNTTVANLKNFSDEDQQLLRKQAIFALYGNSISDINKKQLDQADAFQKVNTILQDFEANLLSILAEGFEPFVRAVLELIDNAQNLFKELTGGVDIVDTLKTALKSVSTVFVNSIVPAIKSAQKASFQLFTELSKIIEQNPQIISALKLIGKVALQVASDLLSVAGFVSKVLVTIFGDVVGEINAQLKFFKEGLVTILKLIEPIASLLGFDVSGIISKIQSVQTATQTAQGPGSRGTGIGEEQVKFGKQITKNSKENNDELKTEDKLLDDILDKQKQELEILDGQISRGEASVEDAVKLNNKHTTQLQTLKTQLTEKDNIKRVDQEIFTLTEKSKNLEFERLKNFENQTNLVREAQKTFLESIRFLQGVKERVLEIQRSLDLNAAWISSFSTSEIEKSFTDIDGNIEGWRRKITSTFKELQEGTIELFKGNDFNSSLEQIQKAFDQKLIDQKTAQASVDAIAAFQNAEELKKQIALQEAVIVGLSGEELANANKILSQNKLNLLEYQRIYEANILNLETTAEAVVLNSAEGEGLKKKTQELEKQEKILKETARAEYGKKIFNTIATGANQFFTLIRDSLGRVSEGIARVVDLATQVVSFVQTLVSFIDTVKEITKLINGLNEINAKTKPDSGGLSGEGRVHVWVDNPAQAANPFFSGDPGRASLSSPQRVIDITKDKDWDEIIFDVPNGRNTSKSARPKANKGGAGGGLSSAIENYTEVANDAAGTLKQSSQQTGSSLLPALGQLAGAAAGLALVFEGFKNGDVGSIFGGLFTTALSILPFFLAKGGPVPGSGNGDTVPAMLTPGEFVINKKSTEQYYPLLSLLNGSSGKIGQATFMNGGYVASSSMTSPKVDVFLSTRFEKLDSYKIYVNGKQQADTRQPKRILG